MAIPKHQQPVSESCENIVTKVTVLFLVFAYLEVRKLVCLFSKPQGVVESSEYANCYLNSEYEDDLFVQLMLQLALFIFRLSQIHHDFGLVTCIYYQAINVIGMF